MNDTGRLPPLSPADARQIDQTCDRFEAAWKAGPRPRPEDFLGTAAGPVRSALLRQLLLLDCDYRRRAGDEPSAGDYHSRFSDDTALIEDACREKTAFPTSMGAGSDESRALHVTDSAEWEPAVAGDGANRYDLGPEVGHGGIGVVYRCRDRHLGRELAVKVLREVYRDNPEARRRLVEEARVGSQLQHPAIVPVYELGWFGDRRPYFTMKLVEGHTLAALLKDRADPGQDLPRLLGIFEQVCQAMAYAHDRGVIHRDLKPANVMVGAFGEVQVMDWGFAKRLRIADCGLRNEDDGEGTLRSGDSPRSVIRNPAARSHSGILMGTPAYMPPEQARGEAALIDPRADVFALGAILCEILTGRPPYVGGSADEVCRKATDGDLGDAHARLDACGADAVLRDLAWRCLAAERSARPPGAGVVERDVTAYLASAQERLRQAQLERAAAEARAQEAGAKAKAERHALRLTLALAAALLVGTAVAAWQAVVATRAKRDALAAAAAQAAAKETADAKEAETRAVLDFVEERVFAAARPLGQEGGLGQDVTLRRALEAALPVVDQSFANQPLTEARLRMTVGGSFWYLGDATTAAEQFAAARVLYTKHRGPDDYDTFKSILMLANCYADFGRHAEALKIRDEALALSKATLGPDHLDTLKCMNNLALSYAALGRYAESIKLHEETLALATARVGRDHHVTLQSMNGLANRYAAVGRHAEALKLREETLALFKAKAGPDHPDTLKSFSNLANSYAAVGRHAEALKLREETLALSTVKLGSDHPDTLKAMNDLASSYADLGRHAEALQLREQNLALRKVKLGPDHPDTLWSMFNLGNTYAALGRHPEALRLRQQTLQMREAKLGPKHPDTLRSMWSLAENLVQLDRGAEAVSVIDECVRRSAGQVVHSKLIPAVMNLRLRHFEKAKDAAGCQATAEMWEALNRSDAASLYTAARYRAVTAAVVRATDQSPGDATEAAAEVDRAVAWLTKAVAAGYKDGAHMKNDKDLDALRDRLDFRALLAELGTESLGERGRGSAPRSGTGR